MAARRRADAIGGLPESLARCLPRMTRLPRTSRDASFRRSGKGTWAHAFGTDNLGRDYLSRIIFGARISLLTGVSVMVISGLIGTALGLAAGYFGGRTDMAVTFVITVRLALPLILVALAVVATMPYPLHPLS